MSDRKELLSAIYEGSVFHKRNAPKAHGFRYGVYSLLIDLDELTKLNNEIAGFSVNKWNIFSFHFKDHGARDGSDLKIWCHRVLKSHGIVLGCPKIQVLCFPRVLGYTFNPISVWFCYDSDALSAIIYEVHNTFGTDHSYVVDIRQDSGEPLQHRRKKQLHVSPFFDMEGGYDFRIRPIDNRYHLNIRYYDQQGNLRLVADHNARRRALNAENLRNLFWQKPLLTAKVVAGIHWEALHLFTRKRARYHHPPSKPATISSSNTF